jgi:amino acid permease
VLFAFSCQVNVCPIFQELVPLILADVGEGEVHETASEAELLPHQDPGEPSHQETTTEGHGPEAVTSPVIDAEVASTKKTVAVMHNVTVTAVAICALLYAGISFAGLADFGDDVRPNILSNYPSTGIMLVACTAMAVAVVTAFPLNIFPARTTLTELLFEVGDEKLRIPKSSGDENLTEAFLQDIPDEEVSLQRQQLQQSQQAVGEPAILPVNDNDFSLKRHVVLTLAMTVTVLALALVLPNISTVFGLLGGTASSLLGFCVPGLLGLRLPQSDRRLVVTSWLLLIGGIVVGTLTTGVTVYGTFRR